MMNDQLLELKAKTPNERISHFFKKLTAHEITRDQYDQAIRFCRTLEGNDTRPSEDDRIAPPESSEGSIGETLVRAFGGKIIEDKPASQKERLLNFLGDYCWHDTPSIMTAVYGMGHQGVCRISERVRELKAEGHDIESRKKSHTIQEYKLNNPNKLV